MLLDSNQIPLPKTLADVLASTVASRGALEAYVGPGERRTWSELQASGTRMARALLQSGVRRGDHVGILLGNESLWIEVFFGCAMIGAVAVPVNTRFKPDELQYCLRQANIKLLIYASNFLGIDFQSMLAQVEPAVQSKLPGTALPSLQMAVQVGGSNLPGSAISLQQFLAAGELVSQAELEAAKSVVSPQDILLIQYTSGTTSFPKGVMLTHLNMIGDAASVARRMGVQPTDRYFSIRPFFHVAGSTLSILVSLVSGCCLLSLPKFDVAQALDVLDTERCTLTSGNDTIFLMLIGHPDFDKARIHLRGGWAAAGPEVMLKISELMGVPHMCNAYGQSEASPNVLLSDWDDSLEDRRDGFMFPHPGVEVRLADAETGEALSEAGAQGEIQVRGWNVMRGYHNQPEATAKAFTPEGWLKTGDLGERNAQGRFRMVGRLKDMFRVGGENVAPAEVEEVFHSHPAIQQAQVIGVPDARLGEVTAVFILLKDGCTAERGELIAWSKQRCANFKVPRYLDVVDTFEHIGMTGSSKIQKNKLREHATRLWNITATTIAPSP
ncbi:AMP-binding protein [Ottowia thiooxydans]|uniref:AMP-binding protein n=1 Tax=Ottowia thiooxydans TaxID=219182 RepID=UPI000417458F|nr:AMP-binding protein [Ottowia thiooxydans]